MSGEFDYIRKLRHRIPPAAGVIVGPGDDCAVLARPTREQLITTDMLQDGVDFILSECGPFAAGRKAMAVNLSDIAAMAGRPTAAVVGLCLPKSGGMSIADQLFDGLKSMADEFQVPIVGGDTNSWDGPLVISVTVLGETTGRGALPRSGAKLGDWVFVTGPLGGSILGRHLEPRSRIREAIALHEHFELHAMIDISDGLAVDLWHICEESGCGAELNEERIPIHRDAHKRSKLTGNSPLNHALFDGEDFELAFTVSPEDGRRLVNSQSSKSLTIYQVGLIVASGFWLVNHQSRKPLQPSGWVHTLM